MKALIIGLVTLAIMAGAIAYLPSAYSNERCGEIEKQLQEKQKYPEMYPGLQLTPEVKQACPAIASHLAIVRSLVGDE